VGCHGKRVTYLKLKSDLSLCNRSVAELIYEYNYDNYRSATLGETIDLLECVEFLLDLEPLPSVY